jgi:hypothetical protein
MHGGSGSETYHLLKYTQRRGKTEKTGCRRVGDKMVEGRQKREKKQGRESVGVGVGGGAEL